MSKFTKIPSGINEFFKEKRRDAAIFAFTRLIDDLRLDVTLRNKPTLLYRFCVTNYKM